MNLGIRNKRVLITGGSRGIGRAIASALAKEGARLAIVARTKPAIDMKHYAICIDLAKEGGPKAVVDELNKKFGSIDIVINNVGDSLNIRDPFCSISDWRRLWRINMEIAVEINNLTIPAMRKKKWGRIVNISSIAALENQGAVPYCSIKAALTAYSRSMGRVLAPEGIIMTSILPGAVFTKGGYWDQTSKSNPKHVKTFISERMAIKRFGKPEEIANVVAFFCSEHASFCVGSMIPVDGGQGRVFFT